MSNLAEHSMINNFVDSVDSAIKEVGGDTSSVANLCDYPRIIREQLIAGIGEGASFEPGAGIKIDKEGTVYTISANANAPILSSLIFNDIIIPQNTPIQQVFDTMFTSVFNKIPSIISGDIITSTSIGTDQYQHPNGDPEVIRVKKGLNINAKYLRIFIVSQEEPIYILLDDIISGGGIEDAPKDGKQYVRQDGMWVEATTLVGETTAPLSPPHPIDTDIPTGTPFQEVFEKLFDEILPAMPSVLKGDIILSSDDGTDQYQHPDYQKVKVKSGLDPENYYIRLFIASQEEPVYISCEPLKIQDESGKIYNGSIGEHIDINVDNVTNIISANLKSIPDGIIDDQVAQIINENALSTSDAQTIFNEVFN